MIDKTVFQSSILDEKYEKFNHPSGLEIYVFPKKLTTAYAIFGVKYGSIHNCFSLPNSNEKIVIPDGVAHFLEPVAIGTYVLASAWSGPCGD